MSLEGEPFGEEMAEMGGYRDKWDYNQTSCYFCGLIFQMEEITTIMNHENIDFKDAGYLVHAILHPWCEILQNLPMHDRRKVLGSFQYIKYIN